MLTIINMATVQNLEVISNKHDLVTIGTNANYAQNGSVICILVINLLM